MYQDFSKYIAQNPSELFLVSAPLAALSHPAMRQLWLDFGACDLIFSEMISSEGLLADSPFLASYLDASGAGEKTVYQLVGSDEAVIVKACQKLLRLLDETSQKTGQVQAFGIDINMGCSAPEMTRKQAGVQWMGKPEESAGLVTSLRTLLKDSSYSLSVKCRLGLEDDPEYLVTFCKSLEACGLDFITLHGRTKKDPWGRPAKLERFPLLARELTIPLLANGDLGSLESLKSLNRFYTEKAPDTNFPGIMLGRSAIAKPWIFESLKAEYSAAKNPESDPPSKTKLDLLKLASYYHELLERFLPKEFLPTRTRRFYAWFCTNLRFGNRLGASIQNLKNYSDIFPYFRSYLENNEERYVQATLRQNCRNSLEAKGLL